MNIRELAEKLYQRCQNEDTECPVENLPVHCPLIEVDACEDVTVQHWEEILEDIRKAYESFSDNS